MPRDREKNKPSVASTGCSSLMSRLSLQRRSPPHYDDEASGGGGDDAEAEKRMQFLEKEIRRLAEMLGQEEERVVRGRAESVTTVAEAKKSSKGERRQSSSTTKSKSSKGEGEQRQTSAKSQGKAMAKLEDGSYLREVRRLARPWERLAVQVSRPVIPEDAKSASQVLDKMAAMRPDDLCRLLAEMFPLLKDIAGPGEPVRRPARLSTGDDLLEALVVKAMDKMELLVLGGLKIQMHAASTDTAADRLTNKKQLPPVSKNCMVHVVLMQARDPRERYIAIGDTMVGVIEAALATEDGSVELDVQGMHVAGVGFVNSSKSLMWSASLRQCRAPRHGAGDGCCCYCVRNLDRAFPH